MSTLLLAAAAQQAAGGGAPPTTFPVIDTFTRTVGSGWGSPDQGLAYVTTGTTGGLSVGSGKGNLALGSATYQRLIQQTTRSEVDQTLELSFSALTLTGNAQLSFMSRYADNNNFIAGAINVKRTGYVDPWIRKRVSGTNTDYDYDYQPAGLAGLTASDTIYIRCHMYESASNVVVDLYVDYNAPATTLRATYTDTSPQAAGYFGFDCYSEAAVTNTPTWYIDNYSAS